MTIYDGLIEMREAGMNSTSLVFLNMISSSFLIKDGNGSGSARVEQYHIHTQIHEDIMCPSTQKSMDGK